MCTKAKIEHEKRLYVYVLEFWYTLDRSISFRAELMNKSKRVRREVVRA